MFQEQVSSVAHRVQLDAALGFVRDSDTFMVTKVDRLARSMVHLMEIVETLRTKRVRLVVKDLGLDTGTPTGSLILNVLGAIAQFERTMMLERQAVGIAKAKADGKYTGRGANRATQDGTGAGTGPQAGARKADIARELKIGVASVYRILGDAGAEIRA